MAKYSLQFPVLLCFFWITFSFNQASAHSKAKKVPGEFIVKYKSQQSSGRSLGKTTMSLNLKLQSSWRGLGTYHFKAQDSGHDQEILRKLNEDPNVLIAEPNYYVSSMSENVSDDIYYEPTSDNIEAPQSWYISSDYNSSRGVGEPTVVAIIDSGLDTEHEVFDRTGRLWVNEAEAQGRPGVDDDNNGFVDDINGWNFIDGNSNIHDVNGHGTRVSGIVIGSAEPLSRVIYEPEPRIKVMPLKFLDEEGVGKTSDAIDAIYYAIENGARVINNSWGGPGYSSALLQAITFTYSNNAVFVAAAGNETSNNDRTPIYPASYDVPNIISVGASTGEYPASFSNYGSQSVHLSAPGVLIYSTLPGGDYGTRNGSGTSMSAPFISGLASLMLKEAPQHSGFQVKRDMLDSVDPFPGLNNENATSGRVNFRRAIAKSQENIGEENYLPFYEPDFSSRGLASLGEKGAMVSGCGRVQSLYKDNYQSKDAKFNILNLLHILIVILPLIVLMRARKKIEKRSSKRLPVGCRGTLTTLKGQVFHVIVCDLSQGGAAVKIVDAQTSEVIESMDSLGGSLKVFLKDAGQKKYSFKLARVGESDLGLAFD